MDLTTILMTQPYYEAWNEALEASNKNIQSEIDRENYSSPGNRSAVRIHYFNQIIDYNNSLKK